MTHHAQTIQPYVPATTADTIKTKADEAADAVKKRAARAVGRAATILTGPLGASGDAPATAKTLLGS